MKATLRPWYVEQGLLLFHALSHTHDDHAGASYRLRNIQCICDLATPKRTRCPVRYIVWRHKKWDLRDQGACVGGGKSIVLLLRGDCAMNRGETCRIDI